APGTTVGAFGTSSRVQNGDGEFTVAAAGGAAAMVRRSAHAGVSANLYAGALTMSAPRISPDAAEDARPWSRENLFYAGDVKGYARRNLTTGKIEFYANGLDLAGGSKPPGPLLTHASYRNAFLRGLTKGANTTMPYHYAKAGLDQN